MHVKTCCQNVCILILYTVFCKYTVLHVQTTVLCCDPDLIWHPAFNMYVSRSGPVPAYFLYTQQGLAYMFGSVRFFTCIPNCFLSVFKLSLALWSLGELKIATFCFIYVLLKFGSVEKLVLTCSYLLSERICSRPSECLQRVFFSLNTSLCPSVDLY